MKRALMAVTLAIAMVAALGLTSFAAGPEEEIVGTLEKAPKSMLYETPYLKQCELGSVVSDAVREYCASDIALINVGDLQNDLNRGTVTMAQVQSVFQEDRELAVAELTGAELRELLEHAVSQVVVDPQTEHILEEDSVFEGFCQISGLTMTYDVSAPPGTRITKLTMDDGTAILSEDDGTLYQVAATTYMLEGGYDFPTADYEQTYGTLTEALAEYVRLHGLNAEEDEEENNSNRITVIGALEGSWAAVIPKWGLFAGCAVLAVLACIGGFRLGRYRNEYGSFRRGSEKRAE